ncbi:MAG TPA: DinB family protein [Acidimicrobiales bacterium]|nr:DinB family protein [Acidimicrobiales bacterium]
MTAERDNESRERADLVQTLAAHRSFLRWTVRGLTDEQAGLRTTSSELCLGGIIKHVSLVEENWCNFIIKGPNAIGQADEAAMEARAAGFQMLPGETLQAILERYDQIACGTEELIATPPSLDASQPLPEAPWFEPGARWTARRAIVHILAETAQHAGHADIIRESLDGAKTMG